MTTNILPAGTVAQYRKVGKVRIIEHVPTDSTGAAQLYLVVFITGPKKYREAPPSTCYIDAADAVTQ